jgi:hypothetical protein
MNISIYVKTLTHQKKKRQTTQGQRAQMVSYPKIYANDKYTETYSK